MNKLIVALLEMRHEIVKRSASSNILTLVPSQLSILLAGNDIVRAGVIESNYNIRWVDGMNQIVMLEQTVNISEVRDIEEFLEETKS